MSDFSGADYGVDANRASGREGYAGCVDGRCDPSYFAQGDGAGLLGFFAYGKSRRERRDVAAAPHFYLTLLRGFDGAGGEQIYGDESGFEKCLGGFLLLVVMIHGGK